MRRDLLRQWLTAFAPFDKREGRDRQRMLELLDGTGDPFARSHFVPGHFTASAFVLNPAGELLLIFHGKLHRWLQPGGHVDPADADLRAAAGREVEEETGLTRITPASASPMVSAANRGGSPANPIFDLDIHPIPALRGEPAHEHFDVRFLFNTDATAVAAASDARAARWFPLAAVNADISDRSVLRAIAKLGLEQ